MRNRHLLIFVTILFFLKGELKAQSLGVVEGVVKDAGDGTVPNAKVIFEDRKKNFVASTLSDREGRFKKELPEGQYIARAEAQGYRPSALQRLVINSGKVVNLQIKFPVISSNEDPPIVSERSSYNSEQQVRASKLPELGIIKDDSDFQGCGCSLYLNLSDWRKHHAVFMYDFGDTAIINLDGKDLKLKWMNDGPDKESKIRVGHRSWELYQADEVRLRVDYTVTKLCKPDDESCEITYYNAVLTLTVNGKKSVTKAIGLCGC